METGEWNGFFNVLKPTGMTSSDVVVTVRRMLPRGTAVGHGGTLDPDAAGVLPVCVGRATRLFDYIIDKQKTYIAELTLGVETDTQDQTGRVVRRLPVTAGRAEIEAALPSLVGDIQQIPPMFSAIKRDGRRMYDLARRGQTVALEPRTVHVDGLEYLSQAGEDRHRIAVYCRKGVYVRTLMHDLGRMLGCGGHMSFLMRSRAGVFDQAEAHTVEELRGACERGALRSLLTPMDAPILHLPRVDIPEALRKQVLNGAALPVAKLPQPVPQGQPLRLYLAGWFAGIGLSDAERVRFQAMLLEREPAGT
ncbi:MAG: tRNA pseudouridine(55) synthase TruB [Clostridia bacterium]|nr:tRNA pseudouridine(55) synthase TruB [Clostridia bacterium]